MTNKEFENEIVDYWRSTEFNKNIPLGKFKSIARYFYGLGLDSSNNHEERVPEIKETGTQGLEEAAEKSSKQYGKELGRTTQENYAAMYDFGQGFKVGAEWAFRQFEPVGTLPVEDARGGYWPTEYFIRKK